LRVECCSRKTVSGLKRCGARSAAPLVLAADREALVGDDRAVLRVRGAVARGVLLGDDVDPDAAELRDGAGEVLVDEGLAEADRLEGLRSRVARHGRDAHLGHDLEDALAERLDHVLDGLLGRDVREHAAADELLAGLHREVRVDRRRAVADQGRDVVHLADVAGLDDQPDAHPVLGADQVVVHGGEHQQRRDRSEVLRGVAVREHEELRPGRDRLVGLAAHLVDAVLHGARAGVDAVETADRRRDVAERTRGDVLDLGQLVVVDHREVEDDLAGVLGSGRQQVALRAEPEAQRRDDLLADGVERRVGDLRERLGEVVEEQAGALGQHGDGRVGAHRSERLGSGLRHRQQEEADLLLGVAERALTAVDGRRRVHDVLALGQVLEVDAALVEPLLERTGLGELPLDLLVLDDAALLRVDQEHATGLEAPLADDLGGVDVEHADLAREHDEAVVGDDVPARTQPVAVEGGADELAVGEDDRGGAVPRLHEHRVVLVERTALLVDRGGLVLPRLRHHHHDRVRQRAAGEVQQLDGLVERGGVAAPGRDDREQRRQVAQLLALQLRLARAHPVAVALHGVDLAVVRDHAERLRQRPGRERVRRVPRVHERELRGEALVLQVGVERLELEGRDHALVDERPARQRHEVHLELALDALAQAEGQPVQAHGGERRAGLVGEVAPDVELLDRGHRGAGERADLVGLHRDGAPADDRQVLLARDVGDGRLHPLALEDVDREERVADGVLPERGQLERRDRAEEVVRDLGDDARAVAGARIGADRAAVLEVAQGVEGGVDDVVPGGAAHGGDHRETAGVLLGRRVVHALSGRSAEERHDGDAGRGLGGCHVRNRPHESCGGWGRRWPAGW
jgi:hypothetical protein